MRFEWDETKNERNIRMRGIDFADAWRILEAPMLQWRDLRRDYGEERWRGLGVLNERVVAFAYTMRAEDLCRWITVRTANAREIQRLIEAIEG